MIKYFFTLAFIVPTLTQAQIALPSIFPDTKSVNPAVISKRKFGMYTAAGSNTKVNKDMKLSKANGSPIDNDLQTEVKLRNFNFFRGGKGGGFTTELSYDQTNGKKKDVLDPTNPEPLVVDSKASSSYVNYAVGLGQHFGLSAAYIKYDYAVDFSQRFGSTTFSSKSTTDLNVLSVRPGFAFGIGSMTLGTYYDYIKFSGENENSFTATGQTPSSSKTTKFPVKQILGVGLANSWQSFHVEISHELMPFEKKPFPEAEKPKVSSRTSGIVELKIKKISLGYKGQYFKNSFSDLDKIINSQMLFGNMEGSSRLENNFNFGFGSDKGFSVGVSFAYSKYDSKEKPDIIQTTAKQETKVKFSSYGLKMGYLF